MFIKNYSNVDFAVNVRDDRIILKANTIVYVDENIITAQQLKNMYGTYVDEITDATVTASIPKKQLSYYQQPIALLTLYKVKPLKPQQSIFIGGAGTVDIRVYSGATQPTALASMSLSTALTGVSGDIVFTDAPTYIAVKQNTGTTTEIVLKGLQIISNLGAIA